MRVASRGPTLGNVVNKSCGPWLFNRSNSRECPVRTISLSRRPSDAPTPGNCRRPANPSRWKITANGSSQWRTDTAARR